MKISYSLLALLLSSNICIAQIKEVQKPKTDTLIEELHAITQDNIPTISLDDDEAASSTSTAVSSILSAGRNPFVSAAEFNFSPTRFRLRGYESKGNTVYLNGIDFISLDNGFVPYNLWGGLNNIMRSKESSYGLEPNNYAVGTIGLNTNIDLRAGAQWKQTQVGYALSNRNYKHRFTINHGSGFNPQGWAYSFALTTRYADEGAVPGTYYRGLSYYAAVDKKSGNNILSFITFGAPTENGRQSASTQEALDLAGNNLYNPSWGYQMGKKRNSNVAETFQPTFMLVNEYKINNRSNWQLAAAYTFGNRKVSGFDWNNAPDPRPDYYRYLPSYYQFTNPNLQRELTDYFLANPDALQVNWHKLYDMNRNNSVTIKNVDGINGNNITGNRALTILSNRVTHTQRFFINTTYNNSITIKNIDIELSAGAHYKHQSNHYYQEVKDLLGGDFWLNTNQFAERDNLTGNNSYIQYDINKPNQLKKAGDAYGYNYKMTMNRAAIWGQANAKLNHIDFFASTEIAYSNFYRTGLVQNGMFPNNSLGKSAVNSFINLALKAGATYKIDGRNYLFARAGYITDAPYFENVFISARNRNTIQDQLKQEITQTVEAGYKLLAPNAKISVTGYYTKIANGYDVMSAFYDAEPYKTFVNIAIKDIEKIYFGSEIGAEVKLTQTLTLNAAAAIGRYYYNNRPTLTVTADNEDPKLEVKSEQIYWKNYRIPSTPQNAYSMGLFYRSPKYWFVSLTGNYFSNAWLSPNPIRRIASTYSGLDASIPAHQEAANKLLAQEQFAAQFTLDAFAGWNKRLPTQYQISKKTPTTLVLNIGVSNLLNNKNIKSGGYEQLRIDQQNNLPTVGRFAPKYYYAYGINYFASIAIRF